MMEEGNEISAEITQATTEGTYNVHVATHECAKIKRAAYTHNYSCY